MCVLPVKMLLILSALLIVCDGNSYQGGSNLKIKIPDDPDMIAFPEVSDDGDSLRPRPHHHHNHRLREDTFRNGNDRPGVIPGIDGDDIVYTEPAIPIDFMKKFNSYDNISDLLLNLVDDQEPAIANRFFDVERSAVMAPKPAVCMPEVTTVTIATSDDPSVIYIPECTRVKRCGGCCSHNLLTCRPIETETLNYLVIKTQFVGGQRLKATSKEAVLVEQHIKCKCDCKIQPENCNQLQEYRRSQCQCVCKNIDEQKKCHKQNDTKLWNPERCACQCRDETACSTGNTFDVNTCKCLPLPIRRRFAQHSDETENNVYKSAAFPVVPLH